MIEDHNISYLVESSKYHESKPFTIYSRDLARGSGAVRMQRALEKSLKQGDGKLLAEFENNSSINPLHCKDHEHMQTWYDYRLKGRALHRRFYYNKRYITKKRQYTYKKRRYYDRICAKERRYASGIKSRVLVMFIGDRGYGVNSTIKGHLKYGGFWKAKKHSFYATVAVINEHNTSQTCIYCSKKLLHPLKNVEGKLKEVNGTFYCPNKKRPLQKTREQSGCRDKTSAIAIALFGMVTVILGVTSPCFDPKATNEKKVAFIKKAIDF
jgi:hypothetical protein